MLEIMEGVIKLVTSTKEKTEPIRAESVDADGENSSDDETNLAKKVICPKKNSDGLDPVPLNIPETPQDIVESTDSTGPDSELEDESYSPDRQKCTSKKKKSPQKLSAEKSTFKLKGPKKKLEQVKISVDDFDAEFPKIYRKRRFPSHFSEFAFPNPEEEVNVSTFIKIKKLTM